MTLACSDDEAGGGSNPGQGPPPPLDPPCASNDDCSARFPVCDGLIGCVECLLDAHCSEPERCRDKRCVVPEPCALNGDCDGDEQPVCNTVLGECVGCVVDATCGDAARCAEGRCVEVNPCVNTRDCPEGLVCDRDREFCVSCVSAGDCPEDFTCVESSCVRRCESDLQCRGTNQLCDTRVGHCVDCVEHVDCPELYNCQLGRCVVDRCIAGSSTCNETFSGRQRCNELGSDVEISSCPPSTTCVEDDAFAICRNWICQPNAAACDADGTTLLVCAADGLEQTESADCAAQDGVCENGACADIECDAGTRFCQNEIVHQCNALGTSFTPIQACAGTEYCDEATAQCLPRVCTPGAPLCDGDRLTACDARGSGPEASGGTDCTDDDGVCEAGACRPVICDDGTSYCKDGEVYTCAQRGIAEIITRDCGLNEYCDETTAECRIRSCTPGVAYCQGERTGVCNAAGSAIDTSSGTDCASLTNQACYGGVCLPKVCQPGVDFCQTGNVRQCLNNGTSSTLRTVCSASQYCNEANATCTTRVCEPGVLGCSNNAPATCNINGSGYINPGPACPTGQLCVGGSCLPLICTPSAVYCSGGNPHRCGADGTTTVQLGTCQPSQYCLEGATSCQNDVCTADMPTCAGDFLATCKSDGSGPVDAGMACPTGQICDTNQCRPVICSSGFYQCMGQVIQVCNARGTAWSNVQTCTASNYCNDAVNPAACSEDICSAGQPACDAERPATCNADGGTFSAQGADCNASDQVCTTTGCADDYAETVASATSSSSATTARMTNRYYAANSRTLTAIEQYMTLGGTFQLTWVVYESYTPTGVYTRIFDRITVSSGSGVFHSSGAISVPLVGGRYYMIGVRPEGAVTYHYLSTTAKQYTSFGFVTGGQLQSDPNPVELTFSFSTALSARFHQRITTAPAD